MTLHGNVNKTINNPEHINSSIERCELQVISMVVPGVHYRSNSSYLQCMVPIASYLLTSTRGLGTISSISHHVKLWYRFSFLRHIHRITPTNRITPDCNVKGNIL